MAAMMEESTPPEMRSPYGTSHMSCRCTASVRAVRSAWAS